MLRRLLKHELRAGAAPVLLLSAGVLAVSGFARLMTLLSGYFEFFTFFASIATTLYIIGAAASHIFVYVLIVRRFYTSVYGGEGYLTLMLPAPRWKLLASKFTVSLLWLLVNGIAVVLSVLIIASYPEAYRELRYLPAYLGQAMGALTQMLGMPSAVLVMEVVLACILGVVQGVLMLYASVSIGQLFRRHRLLGSAAGYLMLYAAEQLVMSGYVLVAGMTIEGIGSGMSMYRPMLDGMSVFQLQVLAVVYLLMLALLAAAFWCITHAIMKKAVNLQ